MGIRTHAADAAISPNRAGHNTTMDAPQWMERPLPQPLRDHLPPWAWEIGRPEDLTNSRTALRSEVLAAKVPPGDIADGLERLLLAYEELASNGLRHGQAPVSASVTAAGDGWLIDVADAAVDHSPVPAVDRDPAHGGLGLLLITRLCRTYGWSVSSGRKHVWGYVSLTPAA
jgi:anti-sigma regulatory factor (Ser/Thr protein kinase)